MIDLHAHIIPGIDDGAGDMAEALEIASAAARQGVKTIVATPHYLPDGYRFTKEELREKAAELQLEINRQGIKLEILTGAEVHLIPDLCQQLDQGLIPTLNKSRYLLLELPFNYLPPYTEGVISDLLAMGTIPVIAHPERYSYFIDEPELLYDWVSNGILAQVNCGSLTGKYGPDIKKTAELLVEHKLVQLIGSDVHSSAWRRGRLIEGFNIAKKLTGTTFTEFEYNAQVILEDRELVITPPQMITKKNTFNRIKRFFNKLSK